MSFVPLLSLGFALGMAHATDPDHVIAVSTIVGDRAQGERSATSLFGRIRGAVGSAMRVGSFWGLGHMSTVLLVGGGLLAFKLVMPASVGLSLELVVALMLIALGVTSLKHGAHAEQGATSAHPPRSRQPLRSFGIGVVHGLAGSAAVALAVLSKVESTAVGIAYLGCFGVGTILGMTVITSALVMPLALAGFSRRLLGSMRIGAGALSLVFGVFLFINIGFVDGLFTGASAWSPH